MPKAPPTITIKSSRQVAAMNHKKICIHGPSGVGKTMLAATLGGRKPLVILTERTGDESLHPSNIEKVFGANRTDILYDIDIIEAFEPDAFESALNYALNSTEHDVIFFDSLSKGSRLILRNAKRTNAHGMKAYGEHNDRAMDLLELLIAGDKDVIAICHTTRNEDAETGETVYVPSFEGKVFTEKSVYDWPHVLFLERLLREDDGTPYRALRCHTGDSTRRCKNRGGLLDELEPPHLGDILRKLSGVVTAPKKAVPAKKPAPSR